MQRIGSVSPDVVSYCTTCKGRLRHLKQTLAANMNAEKDNAEVEFVVLDYDCPDRTFDWLRSEFPQEIKAGRLRCARYEPAPTFEHSHAKNMVHRLATGSILCNVDADNLIARDWSRWLKQAFAARPGIIVLNMPVTLGRELEQKILWRIMGKRLPTHGLAGRIAMRREDFVRLRGYDEGVFSGSGGEDIDFGLRARDLGLKAVRVPHRLWGDVIRHDDRERTRFSSADNQAILGQSLRTSRVRQIVSGIRTVLERRNAYVNGTRRVGCGTVALNFEPQPVKLGLLDAG